MTEPSQYFKGRTVQEQMDEVIGYVDTRAAEVATAAIASDVAQVHQDMLDADADATAAAASAAAAAGTLANAVKKTGEASQSIAGDIDLNDDLNVDGDITVRGALAVTGAITGDDAAFTGDVTVPAPAGNTNAANKKYVDDADALKLSITSVNSYAVGLTGNQTKSGNLTFVDQIITSRAQNQQHVTTINTNISSVASTDAGWTYPIIFRANDLTELGHLTFGRTASGKSYLTLSLTDSNNVTKTITLGVND